MKIKIKPKFKKWLWIGGAGLAVVLLYFALSKKAPIQYTTEPVKRADLIQTVSEVGTLKAAKEIELSFAVVGKINKINVKVGDLVKKDQVLAELDLSSLLLKEKEAKSSLDVARANLNKLIAGATKQDLAITLAQANSAKASYNAATSDLEKTKATIAETITQAQKRVNDLKSNSILTPTREAQAVVTANLNLTNFKIFGAESVANNRSNLLTTLDSKISVANSGLDYVNRIINDDTYKNSLSVKNSIYLTNTQNYYTQAIIAKTKAVNSLGTAELSGVDADLSAATIDALKYLDLAAKTLNNCFGTLENSVATSDLPPATLDLLKTTVDGHITYMAAGTSAVQSADYAYRNALTTYSNSLASYNDAVSAATVALSDAIRNADNTLATAKTNGDQQISAAAARAETARQNSDVASKQYIKLQTPARAEDIDLAKAQVASAQANLDLVTQQKIDSQVKAPIDGQVTKINYDPGEQTSGAKAVMTMSSDNNLEIEVDVSEADISKLKINNSADITFDAFGPERHFSGTVYFIEPAATVISDVIYYKVKIRLNDDLKTLTDLKDGLTANVVITTDKRSNALLVPARAIIDKDGVGKVVRILEDAKSNKIREVSVGVGITGNDNLTEITSGSLNTGEAAITYIKDPNTP